MRHERIESCPEGIIKEEGETLKGALEFFNALETCLRNRQRWVKGAVRVVIEKAIEEEFRAFIGCLPYERTPERKDYRNGYLRKAFETRFGIIEEILIPRAKGEGFFPSIFKRWQRREGKISRPLSDIFLRGVSTRKIKAISKALSRIEYSASKVSEFNKALKEEFLSYFNRPIDESA